jgi:hypothetical protein
VPTLDWIGKQAVLNHHREVRYLMIPRYPAVSADHLDAGKLPFARRGLFFSLGLPMSHPYHREDFRLHRARGTICSASGGLNVAERRRTVALKRLLVKRNIRRTSWLRKEGFLALPSRGGAGC